MKDVKVRPLAGWEQGYLSWAWAKYVMKNEWKSPRDVETRKLWALLRTKYGNDPELVDENGEVWDVWRKEDGSYTLWNPGTKEVIEVPKPERFS